MSEVIQGTVYTPWGALTLEISEHGLRHVFFDRPLSSPLEGPWAMAMAAYLDGHPFSDSLPVDLTGVPPFSRQVLEACRRIPFGHTCSYGQLAAEIGRPRAARAVGQVMAHNPVPVVIPCHRVLGASGDLTGFGGGMAWKIALLEHEKYFWAGR